METTAIGDEVDGTIRLRCIKGGVVEPCYALTDLRELAREYADEHEGAARLSLQLMGDKFAE